MTTTNPLANLRDVHSPAPVSWWPLAPGWYLLTALILLVILVTAFLLYRHWYRGRARRLALETIAQLAVSTRTDRLAELSALLKRCALAAYPRQDVAGLQGQAWLRFLDDTGATTQFTQGPGQILLSAPYQPQKKIADEQIFDIVKQWVRKNL